LFCVAQKYTKNRCFSKIFSTNNLTD